MTCEIPQNPEQVHELEIGCKVCHGNKLAKRDFKMHSKPTKRKDVLGILHSWAYHCLTCSSLIVVRWWQATPSEQMFPDVDGGHFKDD